jgi:hypothetical protein
VLFFLLLDLLITATVAPCWRRLSGRWGPGCNGFAVFPLLGLLHLITFRCGTINFFLQLLQKLWQIILPSIASGEIKIAKIK